MTIEKKLYSQTDVKPVVMFAKRSDEDEIAFPIITDANGNLNVASIQNITTAFVNTDNIVSGEIYTSDTFETLGVSAIQSYVFADRDTIVYVDQGLNKTDWDITDELSCLANEGCSRIIYSVAPYFRIRVKNTGPTTTTEVRIAAGITPIINPLPRALSSDQRFKTETTIVGQQNLERHAWISPVNSLNVNTTVRLIGTNFDGTTKDTNFWNETGAVGSGTVTQSGKITLSTGTTLNSRAIYNSNRRARFVVGAALRFLAAVIFKDSFETDNIRRAGAYDDSNGGFFQLDGSNFGVGFRSDGSDLFINSGSFNGNYGPSLTITPDMPYKLEAEWTPLGASYYVNGILLHSVTPIIPPLVLTLPIRIENINYNDNATNVDFECYGTVIMRQGELLTNPTYYYHALGTTAGVQLKYGAGILHRILINNVVNNSVITISDGLTGVTNPIFVHTAGDSKATVSPIEIGAPFSDGLRLTVATQNACLTLIYE